MKEGETNSSCKQEREVLLKKISFEVFEDGSELS